MQNWVTEVNCLSHVWEEVTLSLRIPTFAMVPLWIFHTCPECQGIQPHLRTHLP